MTPETSTIPSEKLTTLQVVTIILSVYVLIALLVEWLVPLNPATSDFLDGIDFYVCLVFLADFFVRFYRAPSKPAFLKWGWLDFISSIPMLPVFRVWRVVRLIRLFRLLRIFRILPALQSARKILPHLLRDRKTTSFAAVACISFMLLVFSSLAVLQFETSPDANIKTPLDAFWWAYVTITTVGYGDKYPISTEGRIVACILMTAGVGLFGTFTGFVASIFVEPEIRQEESEIQALTREIKALRTQVQSLERRVSDNGPGKAAHKPATGSEDPPSEFF